MISLWAIKAVLGSMELVSRLKVNFHKSCLFGINVGGEFLSAASNFMSCKEGRLPFTFLELPIEANSRKASTWEPVVSILRKRLSKWKKKELIFGRENGPY